MNEFLYLKSVCGVQQLTLIDTVLSWHLQQQHHHMALQQPEHG